MCACAYLVSLGYTVVDRNWSCRAGELDIVCLDVSPGAGAKALVFVEVKSRRTAGARSRGLLFDTVTPRKVRKLRILAEIYLRSRPSLQPGKRNGAGIRALRIDVIGVLFPEGNGAPEIRHLRGAA